MVLSGSRSLVVACLVGPLGAPLGGPLGGPLGSSRLPSLADPCPVVVACPVEGRPSDPVVACLVVACLVVACRVVACRVAACLVVVVACRVVAYPVVAPLVVAYPVVGLPVEACLVVGQTARSNCAVQNSWVSAGTTCSSFLPLTRTA